jgi:mannose-6-phosphate isomerase-like protein (cupin superfamily)
MPDIAHSAQDYYDRLNSLAEASGPTFFQLSAQLPKQGRTNIPLAATNVMSVVLKTYASEGENALHAHINEDHVFLILQGRAEFYGPQGQTWRAGLHEGVLLPRGTFYSFRAISDEPLVMVRIGSAVDTAEDVTARIHPDGHAMAGDSAENKEVPLILHETRWFGPNGAGQAPA